MSKLKVYGWTGGAPTDADIPGRGHPFQQVRHIVAAASKAEVVRIVGVDYAVGSFKASLTETGNENEIAEALAQPGVVLTAAMYRTSGFIRVSGAA